jgi:hypothetical protein
MAQNMERLSDAIAASAERYEGGVMRVSAALDALASDIERKSGGVGSQLSELQSQSKVFGQSMAETTTEIRKVGVEASAAFGTINDSVHSLGALLDGLRELVGSVNRFIRPDTMPGPDKKP